MRQPLPVHGDTHKIGGSDPVQGVFYGVAALEFITGIPINAGSAGTQIPLSVDEGDLINGFNPSVGMTNLSDRIHVPNVMEPGGFYHVFVSANASDFGEPTNSDRSVFSIMSIYDQDENVVDSSFGWIWAQQANRIDFVSGLVHYTHQALYWNNIPLNSGPPDGWHHHFEAVFHNPTTDQGNVSSGTLTVIRYGPSNGQIVSQP